MKWTPATQPRNRTGQFVDAPTADQLPTDKSDLILHMSTQRKKSGKSSASGVPEEIMRAAEDRLEAAVSWMLQNRSYYASVLVGLRHVPTCRSDTLAVDDKLRLFYNPYYVAKEIGESADSDRIMIGLLLHEINHIIRSHGIRCGHRDHQTWNYAGDISINDDLRASGEILPDNLLFSHTFGFPEGLSEEEYYKLLVEEKDQNQGGQSSGNPDQGQQSDQSGNSGSGNENGDGQNQENGGQGDDGQSQSGGDSGQSQSGGKGEEGEGGSKSKVGHGQCGSCATGNPDPDMQEGLDEDAEAVGVAPATDFEKEKVLEKAAQDITDASKSRGNVPAGLARAAENLLKPPQVDWRKVFRTKLLRRLAHGRVGRREPTYSRPPRIPRVVIPGTSIKQVIDPGYKRHTPEIGVVVDTSGSMSSEDITACLSEVAGILDKTKAKIHLVSCDAATSNIMTLKRKSSEIALEGGGGTDMRVGIEALAEKNTDMIVVLTDGYTPWPDKPTDSPLFVGLVHDSREQPPDGVPEWAERVSIHPDYLKEQT